MNLFNFNSFKFFSISLLFCFALQMQGSCSREQHPLWNFNRLDDQSSNLREITKHLVTTSANAVTLKDPATNKLIALPASAELSDLLSRVYACYGDDNSKAIRRQAEIVLIQLYESYLTTAAQQSTTEKRLRKTRDQRYTKPKVETQFPETQPLTSEDDEL